MKSALIKYLLVFTFAPSLLLATGNNVPQGAWRCSYSGSEWTLVPGPQGTSHYQLMPRVYSSGWKKSKAEANGEALDNCKSWSDSGCSFNSCKQKNRR